MDIDTAPQAESVADLVLRLHSPHIRHSQEDLRSIDSSLKGFQNDYPTTTRLSLARVLFDHPEASVRFYSILVFVAVARTPEASRLKTEYINLIADATEQSRPHVEIRKLCDAVATLFCSSGGWPECFLDFLKRCLPALVNCGYDAHWQQTVQAAQSLLVHAALTLADALTEQTRRLDDEEPRNHPVLMAFSGVARHIMPLLVATAGAGFSSDFESPLPILQQVLVHPAVLARKADLSNDLEHVQTRVLDMLTPHIGSKICDMAGVCEALLHEHNISTVFWQSVVQYAASRDMGAVFLISQYRQGRTESHDVLSGAQEMILTVAYHAVYKDVLFTDVHRAEWLQILEVLITEFGREDDAEQGMPFSFKLLSFWNEFIDSFVSSLETRRPADQDMVCLQRAIFEAVFRILPWLVPGSQDDEFGLIQHEAGEVIRAAYLFFVRETAHSSFVPQNMALVSGADQPNVLLALLTDQQTISDRELEVDTCLAAMVAISEFAAKKQTNDIAVIAILSLPVFASATERRDEATRRTEKLAVKFIDAYSLYFTRNPTALPAALQYLMQIVQIGAPESKIVAVQALSTVCRTCRRQLIPYATMLLDEYSEMLSLASETNELTSRLIEAFAAVSYAADVSIGNLDHTIRVIDMIEQQATAFRSKITNVHGVIDNDTQVLEGINLLEMIRKVGESMSKDSGNATTIDLDDDEPIASPLIDHTELQIQQRMVRIVSQILSVHGMADSETALRKVCDLLTLRLHHVVPCFFDFPASLHLEVLRVSVEKQLALDPAVEAFSRMAISQRGTRNGDLDSVIEQAVAFVLQYVPNGSEDPDMAVNALRLMTVFVSGYSDILVRHIANFSRSLMHSTDIITSSETLPKECGCRLWIALLSEGELTSQISEQHWQRLVWNVCSQVAGGASQQDLPILAELTGKLVVAGGRVRKLFEEAFRAMAVRSLQVSGWERFIAQIFMLRGKVSETRRVTIQFWEQCTKAGLDKAEEDGSDEEVIVLDW